MSTRIVRAPEVTRPTLTPLTSSVLDHATKGTVSGDFGLRSTEGIWNTYNLGTSRILAFEGGLFCDPDDPEFDQALWVDALAFGLQTGWKCSAVALDEADMKAQARAAFLATEGRGIEQVLAEQFADDGGLWEATSINTGTQTVQQALALLEGAAAATYPGVPTIHMPRFAASLLGERIKWVGDKAYTLLGSKVAIGGGYDDPTGAEGFATLYATGEVHIEMSEQISQVANVLPGEVAAADPDGSGVGAASFGENETLVIDQRLYRATLDPLSATNPVLAATGIAWTVG